MIGPVAATQCGPGAIQGRDGVGGRASRATDTHGNKEVRVLGMNVFWMVAALVVTLLVVALSFATAVTADARSRRCRRQLAARRAAGAGSGPRAGVLLAEAAPAGRDWPRIATGAWAICAAASVVAVACVGVLTLVG